MLLRGYGPSIALWLDATTIAAVLVSQNSEREFSFGFRWKVNDNTNLHQTASNYMAMVPDRSSTWREMMSDHIQVDGMTAEEWLLYAIDCEEKANAVGVFDPAYEWFNRQKNAAFNRALECERLDK